MSGLEAKLLFCYSLYITVRPLKCIIITDKWVGFADAPDTNSAVYNFFILALIYSKGSSLSDTNVCNIVYVWSVSDELKQDWYHHISLLNIHDPFVRIQHICFFYLALLATALHLFPSCLMRLNNIEHAAWHQSTIQNLSRFFRILGPLFWTLPLTLMFSIRFISGDWNGQKHHSVAIKPFWIWMCVLDHYISGWSKQDPA